MKEIKLTQGKIALVDDDDYDMLSSYKWHVMFNKTSYYASTWVFKKGEPKRSVFMHRMIMNTPSNLEVDHINHDTLDNRKENLRNCTHLENKRNTIKRPNKKSKYLGIEVRSNKHKPSYRVRVYIMGKAIYIGTYKDEEVAARHYDIAATKYFGEFANLNFKND